MPALDHRDREKLVKLLGMIGSSADGEALNAARLANKLVVDKGLTWGQVLNGNGTTVPTFSWSQQPFWTPPPPPPPPRPQRMERWRTVADFILHFKSEFLNEWEVHFIRSILRRPLGLTEKQMATLVKVGAKCGVIVD